MGENSIQPPIFGWKAKLDHQFTQKRSQFRCYNFRQIRSMFMLAIRYLIQYIEKWWHNKTPVMDMLHTASCDQQSGVPLGGIGGGSIGRGFRGEFSRFQMVPGVYEYPSTTVSAIQFIVNIQDSSNKTLYQKVLSCQKKPTNQLSSWQWDFPGANAEYTALYPRSWTVFNIPEQDIKLICRQISPIIPNNYKDSSIPGAVFVWNIFNFSDSPKNVSITFTFQNGIGLKKDPSGRFEAETFKNESERINVCGVLLRQLVNGSPLTYGVATLKEEDNDVSSMDFNPYGNGEIFWKKLELSGGLEPFFGNLCFYSGRKEIGYGLCNRTTVNSNVSSKFVFSLTWDNPIVKFSKESPSYKRYYTKYFGDSGNVAPELCIYCIEKYSDWEEHIESWQESVLQNENLPEWYKSALFNELYYISDGGSAWVLEEVCTSYTDPRLEYGRFFYLEGHEYRMYNTYDVHFYASFALIMLWPKLQLCLQYDFKDAIISEDKTDTWFLYSGKHGYRKVKNTVPHDLGDPKENPVISINSYDIHDVSSWRDLNLKFVLQVYRDFVLTGDDDYARDMFPVALLVMKHSLTWGAEEDGMIKNSGAPDQTYDAWTMSGVSAYCGGLWIAALVAFVQLAKFVEQTKEAEEFSIILDKAKQTFEKELWAGTYYKFDSSGSPHSESIMSDQLCGLWYLRCCDIKDEVFPEKNVEYALNTIYKTNVCQYYNGEQGAVNGIKPNGSIDTSAIQSEEAWTGVTYALASLLIFEGMKKEGFATAEGLYKTVYEKSGLGFATPEALIGTESFRALSYMRPLCIWSMQLAIAKNK